MIKLSDVITLQTYLTHCGRNGVGLQAGVSWLL